MEFSNQNRIKKIKRTFNLACVILAVTGLIFLWLKMDTALLITMAVFLVIIGFAQFANLCFIAFSTENGKVAIRYFQAISFLKKKYESVEFPNQTLYTFQIERGLGFSDLTLVIKTKRGVAEYPSISLAALTQNEIDQIRKALEEIVRNNRRTV